MIKKKSSTSKPRAPRIPKEITLFDGTVVKQQYAEQDVRKRVYRPKAPDKEALPAPEDEAAKTKYPPPKNNPVFRKKWMGFIKGLVSRDSFKEAHLDALEVLCDLYVEYADLERIIRVEGRTYKTVSQLGETIKMHPAVSQLDKVRANIRQYTHRLDLFPKKDNNSDADGEEESWS